MFKVGDKVRLKKEFYKEEYFKKLPRNTRKIAAELAGQGSFDVFYAGAERVHISSKLYDCYDIDASLLEPCKKDVPKPIVKEVKRVAKVGEYIKTVNATMAGGKYKNGDIFKVYSRYSSDAVCVCGRDFILLDKEYVVLEGYEPTPKLEVKEVSRKAKVGEYIKIVHAVMAGSYYKDGDILKVVRIGGNGVYIECGTVVWLEEYVVLENYVPEDKPSSPHKRKWTPEEIVKAKCFLAEELIYAKCRFVYDHNSNRTACYNFETGRSAESKCAPNDEFNQYIGAVVAYCKTCGVKIPEFIQH